MRIRGLRWWMIGLLMLGSIINYLTRSTLGVAAQTLMHDLHITTQQYSWIVATFQVAIMCQPIAGYVLDVVGLKIGFAIFAVAWSCISMAHGLAHSWQAFAGLRGLLGLAEGSANPAGMKATSEWFPAKERGIAGGIFNIGASVGSMLAPPLVAWAILRYNWQTAFVITGALGLGWVVLWLLFYESPAKHRALSDEERDYKTLTNLIRQSVQSLIVLRSQHAKLARVPSSIRLGEGDEDSHGSIQTLGPHSYLAGRRRWPVRHRYRCAAISQSDRHDSSCRATGALSAPGERSAAGPRPPRSRRQLPDRAAVRARSCVH